MRTTDTGTITPLWTEATLVESALPTLRQAWYEAADMARERKMPGLRAIVDSRLDRVASESIGDEASLITIVDECQAMIAVVASDEVGEQIGRKLRRGVYEYLLAIDARRHVQVEAEEEAEVDRQVVPDPASAPMEIHAIRIMVAEYLQERRYAECASTLNRLARVQRGAELAEIACAAGRACRAAGERRAASECFQASCAADPEYEDSVRLGDSVRFA